MIGSAGDRDSGDFFVSYTQSDQAWAEWIAWVLEEDGYQVLIQAWDMVAGSNWISRMDHGIQHAARMVAVLSPEYCSSIYGTAEWRTVWAADPQGQQRKLIPVRVRGDWPRGLLSGVVGIDLMDLPENRARQRLQEEIAAVVRGRIKPRTRPPFPATPRTVPVDPGFPGPLPEGNETEIGSSVEPADHWTRLADVVQGIDAAARPIRRILARSVLATTTASGGGVRWPKSDANTIIAERPQDQAGVARIRQLVQQVHHQTRDGAATAVVLAHELVNGVLAALQRGIHPRQLMEGVELGVRWALAELEQQAVVVKCEEQLLDVIVTATRDGDLAAITTRAVNRTGMGSTILIEQAHALRSHVEFLPGMWIDGECVVPALFTDQERAEAVLEHPYVTVVDQLVLRNVRLALNKAIGLNRPLAIFTGSVQDDEALRVLVTEKDHGVVSVVVLVNSDESLEEVRARTLTRGKGGRARWFLGPLGSPRKIVATKDKTVILWESGGRNDLPLVPILRAGTNLASTWNECRRRAETAVFVALGALEKGVVPGGGIALLTIHFSLQRLLAKPETDRPESLRVRDGRLVGLQVVAQALAAPARQIWQNGRQDVEERLTELQARPPGDGVDLLDGTVGSMIDRGITDALVVVRTALTEAFSMTRDLTELT